ncbi:MAG: hypothetical protein Q7S68_00490 [Deltaproteobacteria bacterium]|nr:hypothetical protein [Deltaproteobacteria bacterium]
MKQIRNAVLAALLLLAPLATIQAAEFSHPSVTGAFRAGGAYGVANFLGGHSGFELGVRANDTGYYAFLFDFHGGYDPWHTIGGAKRGKFTWSGALGYRHYFADDAWSAFAGPFFGYMMVSGANPRPQWITVGLQTVFNYHWWSSERVSVGPYLSLQMGGRLKAGDTALDKSYAMLNTALGFNIGF